MDQREATLKLFVINIVFANDVYLQYLYRLTVRSRATIMIKTGIVSNLYVILQTYKHKTAKQWIVPKMFKLLPKRHIFFDIVIRFTLYHKQEVCFLLFFLGQIVS